jgi:DNA polymerase-3 subunit beta
MSVGEPNMFGEPTIVPTKAVHLLERALAEDDSEVQLAVRQNEILIRNPRATIYSRLLDGRFPRWREVFPQRDNAIRLDFLVGALHSAVRQAAIVTSEESRGIDFTFGDGTLVLSGQTADVGQSRVELPIAYNGESLTITLDPRYLADFLKVLEPEKSCTLDLQDGESAVICSTDDGFGYVIMPLSPER